MTFDQLLSCLTDHEREIVKTKYRAGGGKQFSLKELAAIFQTQEIGIRQELQVAVEKLRREAGDHEGVQNLLKRHGIPMTGPVT